MLQASVTCATTGPVTIANRGRIRGKEGHEVFSESKGDPVELDIISFLLSPHQLHDAGLNFFQNKTLRVKRIYDEPHDTLLYVAYSTRFMLLLLPAHGRTPCSPTDKLSVASRTSGAANDGVSSGRYKCALLD